MPRLVLETDDDDAEAPLAGAACVAGRLASCGLTLAEPQSSRKQFVVEPAGSRWQVRDLKSRNGTYLNEERLTETPIPLSHDDAIRVGETIVRYDAQPVVLPAGLELGNVILGAPRGRSDYGLLYDGRQPSLDRDVTVEVLDPDRAADDAARASYQQRARAAGAFEHSAVVAVFDVAATDQGVYTVFEAYPPLRLSERLAAGGLPRDDALTALRLVAEALHHVHKRGKLHGCLTPRAVFLETDGEGRAKLAGLGEPPGSRLRPFRPDATHFAAYASPEEARGEPPTPASDVFALGLVACEALGGRWPMNGRKAELLERLTAPIDPLELGVAPDLAAALAPLLALDPAARPDPQLAAGVFLELGGAGALSASSAIRRTKPRRPGSSSGAIQSGSGPIAKGSGAVAKGSGAVAKGSGAVAKGSGAVAKGSARQKRRGASARAKRAGSSARKQAGSARAKRASSSSHVPQADSHDSARLAQRSSGVSPRRVSDRLQEPEPPWALPARVGLLTLGYGLIFACAFLLSRIVLAVV